MPWTGEISYLISPGSFCLSPKLFDYISFHWISPEELSLFLIIYKQSDFVHGHTLTALQQLLPSFLALLSLDLRLLQAPAPSMSTCHSPALSSPFWRVPLGSPHTPSNPLLITTALACCSARCALLCYPGGCPWTIYTPVLEKTLCRGWAVQHPAHCSPSVHHMLLRAELIPPPELWCSKPLCLPWPKGNTAVTVQVKLPGHTLFWPNSPRTATRHSSLQLLL